MIPMYASAATVPEPITDDIETLAHKITEGITDEYEMAKAIHCWVGCNIWYNYDSSVSSMPSTVLESRNARCSGYAKLTCDLLISLGFSVSRVTGTTRNSSNGSSHAWVEAYVSGRWIFMDATWDSINKYENGSYNTQQQCKMIWFDLPLETIVLSHYAENSVFIDPTTTARDWAQEELKKAFDAGLLLNFMYGQPEPEYSNYSHTQKWYAPIKRVQTAEAIVRLIEVSSGKTIEQIAEEKGYNMNDTFSDTDSKYATFLKAAGISNGIGNNVFDPDGEITRLTMVLMLHRVATNVFDMDLSGYPLAPEAFIDIPNWPGASEAIGWAAELGITQGVSTYYFAPNQILVTEGAGVFIYRAFENAFSNN